MRNANNLINFMRRLSLNPGVSNYWNPQGLYRDCCNFFTLYYYYIIIIILVVSFMEGIYNYIRDANHVSRVQLFCIYNASVLPTFRLWRFRLYSSVFIPTGASEQISQQITWL